jgi:peptide/nickel transport system substrate-binding protein
MIRISSRITSILSAVSVAAVIASSANANTLRWANATDVTSMDPYAYYSVINLGFLANVYEGLVRFNRDYKPEPALATSWERVDPIRWRFKLRPNVKFHNGDPFTAEDVAASLLRASNQNSPFRPAAYWIKDVKVIDDLTVEIISVAPHATVLNDLTGIYIMDKKWMVVNDALRSVNPSKGEKSFADENANGTGAFSVVSRRPDTETTLKVNPNWWDKVEHNITSVVFRPITSDATRVSALLSGEVDLITPAPLQDVDRLQASDSVKPIVAKSAKIYFLNFNQGAPKLNDSNIADKNPLGDVRVRKALYEALNLDGITSRIMRGMTKPTGNYLAPEVQGFSSTLDAPLVKFDPAEAKKLLAEAGYPNGFEVGFDCATGVYINSEQMCQAITAMWSQIGVKARLTVMPYSIYSPKMLNKKSDIFQISWANTPQMDAFSLVNNIMQSKGTWNPGGYSNPKVDALVEQIRVEQDMKRRTELITEAVGLYKQDVGMLPLFAEPMVWAAKKKFNIFQPADGMFRLYWARFD